MKPSKIVLVLLATMLFGGLFAGHVWAQYPTGNYTRDRAYRHYLNSPSPVKTFSSLPSTRTWGYYTPFESGRFWYTSPYYHERMTYGRGERYQTPGQVGGFVQRWPVWLGPPSPAYPGPYYPGLAYPAPW